MKYHVITYGWQMDFGDLTMSEPKGTHDEHHDAHS